LGGRSNGSMRLWFGMAAFENHEVKGGRLQIGVMESEKSTWDSLAGQRRVRDGVKRKGKFWPGNILLIRDFRGGNPCGFLLERNHRQERTKKLEKIMNKRIEDKTRIAKFSSESEPGVSIIGRREGENLSILGP